MGEGGGKGNGVAGAAEGHPPEGGLDERSVLVNSAGSAIVLLISQKDYEHFNKVWREIVRLWCFAFAEARRIRRATRR